MGEARDEIRHGHCQLARSRGLATLERLAGYAVERRSHGAGPALYGWCGADAGSVSACRSRPSSRHRWPSCLARCRCLRTRQSRRLGVREPQLARSSRAISKSSSSRSILRRTVASGRRGPRLPSASPRSRARRRCRQQRPLRTARPRPGRHSGRAPVRTCHARPARRRRSRQPARWRRVSAGVDSVRAGSGEPWKRTRTW